MLYTRRHPAQQSPGGNEGRRRPCRARRGLWHQQSIGCPGAQPLLGSETQINPAYILIFLVVMALYFVFLEGLVGATLGKWLLGLRVVQLDGSRPGLWKSVLRNALRVVDSLPTLNILGAILISRSAERARFGDRVAGTRVMRVR